MDVVSEENKFRAIEEVVVNLLKEENSGAFKSIQNLLLTFSAEERKRLSGLFEDFFGDEYKKWEKEEGARRKFEMKVQRMFKSSLWFDGARAVSKIDPKRNWANFDGSNEDCESTILHKHGLSILFQFKQLEFASVEESAKIEKLHMDSIQKLVAGATDHQSDYKWEFLILFGEIVERILAEKWEPEVVARLGSFASFDPDKDLTKYKNGLGIYNFQKADHS